MDVVPFLSTFKKVKDSIMNIESLEREISNLPPEEFAKFRTWFLEFDYQRWDERLEADARAGKLDALAEKALTAHAQGKSQEL